MSSDFADPRRAGADEQTLGGKARDAGLGWTGLDGLLLNLGQDDVCHDMNNEGE